MSHIIPMVSGSPPPLDDITWNDEEDDEDDFGNFTGVADNVKSPSSDRGLYLDDTVEFDAFKDIHFNTIDGDIVNKDLSSASATSERPILQNLNLFPDKPPHIELSEKAFSNGEDMQTASNVAEFENISCDTKTLGYLSNLDGSRGRDSMTDSGHCSTDISPVPKSDESPDSCDKSTSSELEDNFNGEVGEKGNCQLFCNLSEINTDQLTGRADSSGCDKDKRFINTTTSNNTNTTTTTNTDIDHSTSQTDPQNPNKDISSHEQSSFSTNTMNQQTDKSGDSPSPPPQPPPLPPPPPSSSSSSSSSSSPSLSTSLPSPNCPPLPLTTTAPDSAAISQSEFTAGTNEAVSSNLSNTCLSGMFDDDSDDWADFSFAVTSNPPPLPPQGNNTCSSFQVSENLFSPSTPSFEESSTRAENEEFASESIENELAAGEDTLKDISEEIQSSSSIQFDSNSRNPNSSPDIRSEIDLPSLDESSIDYDDLVQNCESRSNDSLDGSYSISDQVRTVELKYSTEENQESDDDYGAFPGTGTNSASDNFVPRTSNSDSITSQTKSEEDEFGDFNKFNRAVAESEDEWADFEAATSPFSVDIQVPTESAVSDKLKEEEESSWCSFDANVQSHSSHEIDSGQWAQFSESSSLSHNDQELPDASQQQLPSFFPLDPLHSNVNISQTIVSVMNNTFPKVAPISVSCKLLENALLQDVILQDVTMKKTAGTQKKAGTSAYTSSCCIWKQLLDVDVTDALTYNFTDSKGSNRLFKTLRIDSRKILVTHKKPGVPIFAANLGLLEPSKVISGELMKPSSNLVPSLPQETLIDTNRTDQCDSLRQVDIPPVQFDWTGSGLTNPLEQSAASANTLDLDFLVVKDSPETTISKTGVFESELLGGPLKPLPSFKPMQPLEDMLANTKSTTVKRGHTSDEHLSQEATVILQTLPDLSFMHAKVLMFPVRQTN
ncbi:A-agglutinin anchorage subunit isoform X2 [Octopus sinensis]|uniref:A-agglutinin anchorage subunit isoform X2 n=1 Tax=Octopus sinensis TaxID=2607531 RepID=A0A7E6F749_9MOLL|nr:A-agglutinin anchorage subunit isoform X2 [Octopus sinensis]